MQDPFWYQPMADGATLPKQTLSITKMAKIDTLFMSSWKLTL